MGLLSKLERGATERKENFYSGEALTLTNQKLGEFLGGGTVTGKAVNDTTAMQVMAFFACIRLLAETMGGFPSSMFRREKSGNSTKVEDHSLSEVLIYQPNSEMNGVEYREASTSNLAARGNAYSLIERRGSGDVSSLFPIPARAMEVKRDNSTDYQTRYGFTDRGKKEWYPAEKIWHRKGFSFDGLAGLSPIQCAREAIALALAGEEFNARLFGQGLMPSARVSIPQWLNPTQRKEANEKLLQMHAGLHNMNKPMLLEGGMKVESGLITPDEAQFLQLRQLSVIEICRLLGIKPHMIAALERATDNNIEKLSLEFVMYTMLPHTRRDEMAVRKLLKPGDKDRFFYRYNVEGLLRADSVARAGLYSILLQNGVYSRNEVRALENRNSVDDPAMDQYTVQSNMAMIDQLAALVAARTPPAPEPVKAGDHHIHFAPPSITLNQKSGDVAVTVPERAVHFEATMPEMKPSDVKVIVEPQTINLGSTNFAFKMDGFTSLEEAINAGNERIEKGFKDASRPRKAVKDKDGNPIGMISVDSLEE